MSGAASLVDWPRHTVPIHCQSALRLAHEFLVAPPSRRRIAQASALDDEHSIASVARAVKGEGKNGKKTRDGTEVA